MPEIDTSKVSIARAYDAAIGGKDNFAIDREWAEKTIGIDPTLKSFVLSGRHWLVRTVGYLAARRGVDQFLDLGSGLPTQQNTHEVAQREKPSAHVVYVDNDPAVSAYERAILSGSGHTGFSSADLTKPDEVLSDPVVAGLDWDRPIVLMQCLTLHHVSDEEDPWWIMRRYIDALPSGSYVVLSHLSNPRDGSQTEQIALRMEESFLNSDMGRGWFRSPDQIRAMFDGLELLDPGLVPLEHWWPAGPRQRLVSDPLGLGAVGRKP